MPKLSRTDAPRFLVDRSLGRYIVPERVQSLGFTCITLADFYGSEQMAQLRLTSTGSSGPGRQTT